MSDDIEFAKSQLREAEKNLRESVQRKYVVGTNVRINWMHASTPTCKVMAVSSDGGAICFKLVEPVQHRVPGKGIFQDVGYEAWVSISNIIEIV